MARIIQILVASIMVLNLSGHFALAVDLTEGLVAYWPLNGKTTDLVGGNDGILQNGAEFVEDPERGMVLSTDGAGSHMEVPHADAIAFTQDITLTISVWAKPASLPRTSWTTVLEKNRDVHYNNAYGIWISPSNHWHFRVGATSGDGSEAATKGWHHVLMRHDPAATLFQGFVDGKLVYENTSAAPGTLGTTSLRVGAGRDHVSKNIFEPYPGLIDDLAIYNRFLTDAEITDLAAGIPIPLAINPRGSLVLTWGRLKWLAR